MAIYSNEVLIGTDGWYEWGAAANPEVMDIAIGGWVDHEETDETAGFVFPTEGVIGNEIMFFHMHDRRRK